MLDTGLDDDITIDRALLGTYVAAATTLIKHLIAGAADETVALAELDYIAAGANLRAALLAVSP